jgi:two-component system response regulator NreC
MKILIADDHMIVRNGLTQILEAQKDMTVVAEAAEGAEAFVKLDSQTVDIVLLDMSMPPGENGLHTAKRMKEAYPNLKIVMLTMYDEQQYMEEAVSYGIEGFVVKSEPNEQLLQALRIVMAGGRYYTGLSEKDIYQLPHHDEDQRYKTLTKREKELLPLIALGYSNKEIANQLFLSVKTIEVHKTNIHKKLAIHHYPDLLRYCVKHHLIDF